jgi:hypothetical protein
MLGVASYPKAFVDGCRARIDAQLAAYDGLDADAAFERELFTNLVLVLDHMFMHRLRGKEGKDGNPANEVRLLTGSLLDHGGVMTGEKSIKYDAAKSVTGIALGEPVVLDEKSFRLLADAYFAEIEKRFPPG